MCTEGMNLPTIKKILPIAHYKFTRHFMTMYRILATKWNNLLVFEILLGLGLANLLHSMTPPHLQTTWAPLLASLQILSAIAYY
jgi:uncharacterized membrane protein YagU involved in acid resistance